MIVSRTPYRLSFFGGGTDYPAWYREHGGAVLATSIDKYCHISCRHLPPFFEHRIRVVWSKIELCHEIEEIQHPVVREGLRFLGITKGVEVHHQGDLPARSGMGSSSAFTICLLHALYALKGVMVTRERLMYDGIHLEQDIIKECVGSQDQVTSCHGGFNFVRFNPSGDIAVSPLILSHERSQELNDHLMLAFTGTHRIAAEVAQTVVENIPQRGAALTQMRQMVDEAVAILTSRRDIRDFGALMREGWRLKRGLSERVTNPQIDALFETAHAAGAIGGKLIGAGTGGFVLLFAPPEAQPRIRAALHNLLFVPFRFETSGSQIVVYNQEQDYEESRG
ncbi:MAG: kinase [Planctomycetes bacterium]|nr:kinase [Planctomycetota bacterium]